MAIPQWLTGRFTATVDIAPQVVTNVDTGALGASSVTTQHLIGVCDQVNVRESMTTETIVSMASVRENEVPIEFDNTIELVEILRQGAGNSLLAKCWQTADSADYAVVTITRGLNSFVFTGLMESYSENIAKGRCTARMTFRMLNTGNANFNPTFP